MRIAVIGAGAMGAIYAGLFAEAGHEVWAIDLWEAHVAAIATDGLRLEGASGDRIVHGIHAATDLAEAPPCDLYIIATKAAGVASAARAVAAHRDGDGNGMVLTIQNGLGARERIAEHLPGVDILLGVAEGFGASLRGPGQVHHNAMNLIRIGEAAGGESDRAERLAALWREAGFNVRAYDDIDQLIWEKFICNVTFSAPCTVFSRTLGEVMDDPALWHIALGCALEAHRAGFLKKVNFSFDDPVAYVTAFGAKMPKARPSMLLDHLDRRRSEIDAINGMVPVLGAELGFPTPYNSVLSDAVRAREEGF